MEFSNEIQTLLAKKSELNSRLSLLPYDGTPEIKKIGDKDYLYIRKRVLNKVTSTYVDAYSDRLYNLLVKNNKEAKELKKEIREIDKKLAELGYQDSEVLPKVRLCIDYARKNRNIIIYDQAVLEGIGTTFPDTEDIIENGIIKNAKTDDVQKLLNLKHAWEFILDDGVILSRTDYYLTSYIASLVNDGFFQDGGRIRGVPVTIGGSSYVPPLPIESNVKESFSNIINSDLSAEDKAIEICLYIMKTQIFIDGNKRTAVIAANHYLISQGIGFMAIDYKNVHDFKKMLVDYYEDKNTEAIKVFLKTCINRI